jgi:LysR family transcriptional regulator, cyn operon transcriptional activator
MTNADASPSLSESRRRSRQVHAAAAALRVSQPALSQQIRELEERMGMQLLDRSGRTVRPTDVGEVYLRHVRRALDELEVGDRAIRDVQDLSSGALRLCFSAHLIYLIAPVIRRYRDRYPGIVLTITAMEQTEMERALGSDALDLGLARSEVLADDVEWLPLHTERLSLIVGEGHPAASGEPEIPAATLAGVPLALPGPAFATRVIVDRYLRRNGVQPNVAVEANLTGAVLEIVRFAGLATILPEQMAQGRSDLRAIRLTPAIDTRRIALLLRCGGYRRAATRAFVAVAQDYSKEIED